jgi:ABC-2 type transport system permease protein
LLLCSAWSKSKPFLWAIMIPVFAGVFVTWFNLMHLFNLDSGWFWKNVVAHLLGGVFPGTWFIATNTDALATSDFPKHLAVVQSMYTAFASPQLWVGVVAGIVMIIAAIRLRRWRDDN